MKDIQEVKGTERKRAKYNPDLDKYETMPLFQKKNEEAFALLEKYPPTAWMRKITNERIKSDFDNNMPVDAIAESYKLTREDVLSRLEEMGLIEPVTA